MWSRAAVADSGRGRRGHAAAAVVLTAMVVVAGCDRSGNSDRTAPAATPAVSMPASTPGTAQEEALATYRGMWQAYAKAGLTANPDEPDLARYARDLALKTLTQGLADYRGKGQVIKGDLATAPKVADAALAVSPATVTITDCIDTTKFLVYKTSGELVNDTPGGRRSARATVTNLGADGWKVTSFGVQAVNTC